MNGLLEEARAALYTIWSRKWVALAAAWAICLVGWLAVAAFPNSYESKARIFVQLDDPLAEQIGIGVGDRRRDIDRVRQTLDAANAKLAQDIVQKMIDIFREENLAGNRGEMSQSLEFMDQQLAQRQKELEAAEQKRLAFEAQNPELAQGGMSVMQRLESSRAELRGLDADLAAAQSALAAINGQLAGTPRTLAGGGMAGGARGALAEAQAVLAGMRARGLTENHPDVIAAKNQVNALKGPAAAQGDAGGMPNPAYTSLESIKAERAANVQSLMARRAAVQAELSRITTQQISNPQVAAEQQRINRDYDVLKQQYDKLLQDREQLRLRGQVESERSAVQFEVVDPPTTPRVPAAPNRPLLLAGVLIFGLGGGAGLAFALSKLGSTYSTASQLERSFSLPVVGTISHTMNHAARELRRKHLKYFAGAAGALCLLFVVLLGLEFVQRGLMA